MIRKLLIALSLMLSCQVMTVRADQRIGSGLESLAEKPHPRLLFTDEDFDAIRTKLAEPENAVLIKMHEMVMSMADEAVRHGKHQERVLDASGRRILQISRAACKVITSCAYAYRVTGEKRYLEFAEGELVQVCSFTDWNESHFLDVGEMAIAVSLGYDWLYGHLSEQTKEQVVKALKEKAFDPALARKKAPWFYKAMNNWNQVCNGGLVAAAIAVCEKYPERAHAVIEKAVNSNAEPMRKMYSPHGNYVEGYGYWQYGTLYEVLMLKMLEQSFGTDFGLSEIPGFLNTGDFIMFMKGICGAFNHSDCGSKAGASTALWYFAEKLGRPDLLFNELGFMKTGKYTFFESHYHLPAIMSFAVNIDMSGIVAPQKNIWYGGGDNPVVMVRKDWTSSDSDAYLAVKAGKASNNHGHMDAGSFVYDAYGVRWSMELGMQSYAKVEKIFKESWGNLWDLSQDSRRWTILRYNNFHHSTVTLNDGLHNVNGVSEVRQFIDTDKEKGMSLDMTEVFAGQAKSVGRTVKMLDDNSLVVVDELVALPDTPVKYSWRMVTSAKPEVRRNHIILRSGDKEMVLKAKSGVKVTYTTWSAEPKESYDGANPGVIVVGFEAHIPAGKSEDFIVTLSRR